MGWYAMEKQITGPFKTRINAAAAHAPFVRESIARRLSGWELALDDMLVTMELRDDSTLHRDLLRGIQHGLGGRRQVPMPDHWKGAFPILIESPLPEVRERALALAVQFGDERAFKLLRKIVPDREQPLKERENALKTLLFQQKADLVPILHHLLEDGDLRGPAIRGLAVFDDAQTPMFLLKNYRKWNAAEKSDAIQTLSARSKYALALLDAIDAKAIPRTDLTSYTIRQLQALKSKEVADKLTKVVGEIRPASAEKAKLMAKYKAELKPDTLKKANLPNGRALYAKTCANCHRLFGEGGDIGPDLTGSQRTNLDYVLENVLDPSAIVPREYQVTVVETKQGRTLSGIVKKESDAAITLQLQNEVVVVPKGDIVTRTQTKQSMMPDGIFEGLRIEEVRDLVAYLASPVQVEMKK
jgi:putative heme-binding domain-containing protein